MPHRPPKCDCGARMQQVAIDPASGLLQYDCPLCPCSQFVILAQRDAERPVV